MAKGLKGFLFISCMKCKIEPYLNLTKRTMATRMARCQTHIKEVQNDLSIYLDNAHIIIFVFTYVMVTNIIFYFTVH